MKRNYFFCKRLVLSIISKVLVCLLMFLVISCNDETELAENQISSKAFVFNQGFYETFTNLTAGVTMSDGEPAQDGKILLADGKYCDIRIGFTNSWRNNKLNINPAEKKTNVWLADEYQDVMRFYYTVIDGRSGLSNDNLYIIVDYDRYEQFSKEYIP